ncbi:hypothetical protein ATANTOWER_023707 [Ataeniobius toweri]|uniref:Calpain catalytic domain-containing protein n=1 Tax=Ataeniobius toweri TaxID=208326 RepID=A0ABU7C0E1_9TELE|nr:hypothetical protein [Ataeniobius toweri]
MLSLWMYHLSACALCRSYRDRTSSGAAAGCISVRSEPFLQTVSQTLKTATMPLRGVCQNIMNARQKDGGYGTFNNPEMLFQQNYQHLKEYCLIRNITYIDEMFPPDNMSIGLGKLDPDYLAQVKWLRPSVRTR